MYGAQLVFFFFFFFFFASCGSHLLPLNDSILPYVPYPKQSAKAKVEQEEAEKNKKAQDAADKAATHKAKSQAASKVGGENA